MKVQAFKLFLFNHLTPPLTLLSSVLSVLISGCGTCGTYTGDPVGQIRWRQLPMWAITSSTASAEPSRRLHGPRSCSNTNCRGRYTPRSTNDSKVLHGTSWGELRWFNQYKSQRCTKWEKNGLTSCSLGTHLIHYEWMLCIIVSC